MNSNKLLDKLDGMIRIYHGDIQHILKTSKSHIVYLSKENDELKKSQVIVVDRDKLRQLLIKEAECPNDLISMGDYDAGQCMALYEDDCIDCWVYAIEKSGYTMQRIWQEWKNKCSMPYEIADGLETWEQADDLVRIK